MIVGEFLSNVLALSKKRHTYPVQGYACFDRRSHSVAHPNWYNVTLVKLEGGYAVSALRTAL